MRRKRACVATIATSLTKDSPIMFSNNITIIPIFFVFRGDEASVSSCSVVVVCSYQKVLTSLIHPNWEIIIIIILILIITTRTTQ